MTTEQIPNESGMTDEQFAQSTRNFTRLFNSICEQQDIPADDLVVSMFSSVAEILVEQLGHEATARFLRTSALTIEKQEPTLQ